MAGLSRRICLHCVLLSRIRYSIFLDRPGDSQVRRNEVDDLYLQKIEVFLFLLKKFVPTDIGAGCIFLFCFHKKLSLYY